MSQIKEDQIATDTIKQLVKTPYGWRILAASAIYGGDMVMKEYSRLFYLIGAGRHINSEDLNGNPISLNLDSVLHAQLAMYIIELKNESKSKDSK